MFAACGGSVGDSASSTNTGAKGGTGGKGAGGIGPPTVGADGLPDVRSSDGLRALSRREYVESVNRLLKVRPDAATAPLETLVAGHSKIARSQEIVRGEIEVYYDLGLKAAETAVTALDCKPLTAACARAFVVPFLRRAFREPPAADTQAEYLALLEAPAAGDTIAERLVTMITTALNSPLFLYRQEIGDQGAAITRTLSEHEIATRLAFLAWESQPDDLLLAAADAGKLKNADERESHLKRLLQDPQAKVGLRGFVADWMGLVDPDSRIGAKNATILKDTPADLEGKSFASFEATVDRVLAAGSGAFLGLLSTDTYVADASVVKLLDLGVASTTSAPLTLDTQKRRGVLLHPAVLAAHTGEGGASPFPIGKFVYENLLCGVLGDIPLFPPIDDADLGGKTLRQRLEEATAAPGCQTCHSKISPPGFAFLSYDVVGRHIPNDRNGTPLDTAGTLVLGDKPISFKNAPELSLALATHPVAARCVARRLFRWTFGHFESDLDSSFLQRLENLSVNDGANVASLLTAMVRSEEFARVRRAP